MYDEPFLKTLQHQLQAALPLWSISGTVRLLTISENATFVVDEAVVLRVYRPDYRSRAEIESELAWIAAVQAKGIIETPALIPGCDGQIVQMVEGRFVVAFAFVQGQEPIPDDDLPAWFEHLGAISARLHAHSRQWQPPAGFYRKTWAFETTLGPSGHWGSWRKCLGLDEAGRDVLARTVAAIEPLVAAYGSGPERFGLVHADLRLANLLVEGDRLTVIDFDDCGFSWFVYDFAASISFIEHLPIIPALQAAWINGYRRVARLSAEDEAMIPVFVMLRRILLTAWIATHSETPTAQALGEGYTRGTVGLAEEFLNTRGGVYA